MHIRQATIDDLKSIAAFDQIAATEPQRLAYIERSIIDANCWSLCLASAVIGYLIIDHSFYHRQFLSLLYIDSDHRNSGYGRQAIQWVKNALQEQFFTSTNLSNSHMLYLLRTEAFKDSGIIYNLDPGDPEIIFHHVSNKPLHADVPE